MLPALTVVQGSSTFSCRCSGLDQVGLLAREVAQKSAPVCSGGWPFRLSCAAWGSDVSAGGKARDPPAGLCSARLNPHTSACSPHLHAVLPTLVWGTSSFPQGMRGRTALPCSAPSGHALLPALILHNGTRLRLVWGMAPLSSMLHLTPAALPAMTQDSVTLLQCSLGSMISDVHWPPQAVMPSVERGMCLQLCKKWQAPHACPAVYQLMVRCLLSHLHFGACSGA